MNSPDPTALAAMDAPAGVDRHDARPLIIEAIGDGRAEEWDRFVSSAAGATLYHRFAWRRVITSVFGHETLYLAARRMDDALEGVLPLVRLKSLLFGDYLVSLPFFNYGGVLARSPAARHALLDAAIAQASGLGSRHVELRHREPLGERWQVRTDKVAMLLPLPADPAELWGALSSKVRAQVRRPSKEGAVCEIGGREQLRDFYAVFSRNMRDLGTPVYPLRFFESIAATMPDRASIAVVRLANKPVAAAFLLEHAGAMEIPWASSLRSVNGLGVNMLLYWSVLEQAIRRGCRTFDFGRSSVDSGTYRFKKQWGAQPLQLYWHYWVRDAGEMPRLRPDNPKYRLAIAAWRRLPVRVANWIGPCLIKNLP